MIEGDHESAYFYPDRKAAHSVIQCRVDLQKKGGGNSMIGRELYPLLIKAGFQSVKKIFQPFPLIIFNKKPCKLSINKAI